MINFCVSQQDCQFEKEVNRKAIMSEAEPQQGDATTIKELSDKVNKLTALVERQSKLLAQTGQKLMELQVKDVKSRMAQLEQRPPMSPPDLSDYVNNEDIVQLVTELQTQLDTLEDRTIRRAKNSLIIKPDEKLAPLTNRYGDYPEFELPNTLKDLQELSKIDLIRLALFYEIIIPDQQQQEQELEGTPGFMDPDIAMLHSIPDANVLADNFDEIQMKEVFDEVARYYGVKFRKSDGW